MKVNLVNENFQSDYLKSLLTARGVTDVDRYIHPGPDCLIEPSNLSNIEKGFELLAATLEKEDSNILLVVD